MAVAEAGRAEACLKEEMERLRALVTGLEGTSLLYCSKILPYFLFQVLLVYPQNTWLWFYRVIVWSVVLRVFLSYDRYCLLLCAFCGDLLDAPEVVR